MICLITMRRACVCTKCNMQNMQYAQNAICPKYNMDKKQYAKNALCLKCGIFLQCYQPLPSISFVRTELACTANIYAFHEQILFKF